MSTVLRLTQNFNPLEKILLCSHVPPLRKEKEWNSCGCAIELGMAVPCLHWPDMLQFLDSPVTDVTFKVIMLGCAVPWAAVFISGKPRKKGGTKAIWDCRFFGLFGDPLVVVTAQV
ncbi:hypothetical protein CSKR_203252 [Clonorchis sinensis]|uniref:Uncharacterized protein n=1 Tax=Clonorchis sinensis TaxID=79923 RepID=A0A8T1M811_CLOSI|nr:hypothetical protein CSKR_203252 [Clonorchis sinensis]